MTFVHDKVKLLFIPSTSTTGLISRSILLTSSLARWLNEAYLAGLTMGHAACSEEWLVMARAKDHNLLLPLH